MKKTPPAAPSSAGKVGLLADLKGVLTRDRAAMVRVVKNSDYFVYGLLFLALAQIASVFSQWMTMRGANELAASFGIDVNYGLMDMIGSGLMGFIVGLICVVAIYSVSLSFKGTKQGDLKGFIGLYGFLMLPMVLNIVPLVGSLIALVWFLVLFFTMMNQIFGFGFWKTIGVSILSVLLGGLAAIPIGLLFAALGLGTSAATFSYGDISTSLFNL